MIFDSYIDILGEEFEVQIEITSYQPFISGRVGHIDNWEPDQEEEIEISVILRGQNITTTITEEQYEEFCSEALEALCEI